MIEITFAGIREATEELIFSKPEGFGYRHVPYAPIHEELKNYFPGGCLYVHRDKSDTPIPGCVVGQVFHSMGVPLSVLLKWNVNVSALQLLEELTRAEYISINEETYPFILRYLLTLQDRQDGGYTWHRALAAADEQHLNNTGY